MGLLHHKEPTPIKAQPNVRAEHLAMMKNDLDWPSLLLPLKRMTGRWPEIGYLINSEPNVHLGSFYAPRDIDPLIIYGSWDELLDAGWEVD